MKVGLEVSSVVVGRRSGVGNYVAHMLEGLQNLAQTDRDLELLYFSNRDEVASAEPIFEPSRAAIYPHDRLPTRALWMQLGLPRSLGRTQPDLCHFPNYLAPVLRPVETPYLATMYDMSVYLCPQYQPYKTVAVHRAIIPAVARSAKMIITISESARQDILSYLKIEEDRVRVIYGGVGHHFTDQNLAFNREQPLTAEFRERYGLHFPYVFSVGTLEPRKNHARLIEAFATLVRQERLPHHLVLAGGHGWKERPISEQVAKSGIADRIHFLGYVPAADLPVLYRGAEAFAFPSLYEGFGLPVLEAMACGTPCLISTDPALMEIGGQAALVVDPLSVSDIATQLYRILTNPGLARDLRRQGLVRAAEFSWERCAAETYQLYQEVFESYGGVPYHFNNFGAADSGSPPAQEENFMYHTQSPSISRASEKQPGLNQAPSALERAILETVIYSDIFNFPLTVSELQRFLIGWLATVAEIQDCLRNSAYLQHHLSQSQPYYCLQGREEIFERRKTQLAIVERQWQITRRWCNLLRSIPFLQGVIVTGSLAAESARSQDDIDLLLLVEPGRVWVCRALVIGVVYLARLQKVELCPNYLMALTAEPMTLTQRDLYTARELAAMRLMFGQAEYRRLLELNGWLGELLPNAVEHSQAQQPLLNATKPARLGQALKKLGEKLLGGWLGDKFEQWEQRKIARFSRQPSAETRFTKDLCKGHFGNYGQTTLLSFEQRCAIIDSQTDFVMPSPTNRTTSS